MTAVFRPTIAMLQSSPLTSAVQRDEGFGFIGAKTAGLATPPLPYFPQRARRCALAANEPVS